MSKKAIITGAQGFVAPYLKKELEGDGYEVFGIGRGDSNEKNYYQCDIRQIDNLQSIFDKLKPTHIFHLAGISSLGECEQNPQVARDINVGGTENILRAASNLESVPKILVAGSVHVYGRPEYLPIDEKHPLYGVGVYSETRINQEELCDKYKEKVPIIVTRSFNHTGPGRPETFVMSKIIKQIAEIGQGKRDYLELGNTEVKRDLSDVRDFVLAYRLLLEQDKFGIKVNVCSGKSISLKEVIEFGKKLANLKDVEVRVNPRFVRKNDVMDLYGDTSYLQSLIDWQPKISHEQTFADMYKYWLKRI